MRIQPPANLEAEQSVLGAVLLEPVVMAEVSAQIAADDFTDNRHRLIFHAMQVLDGSEDPIDLVTVCSILQGKGKLEEAGGNGYLAALVDFVPTAANVGYYARQVREKSVARRVIRACREIATEAAETQDVDQLLANALAAMEQAGEGTRKGEDALLTLDALADRYTQHVQALGKTRFTTGFPDLDGIIRGVAPGEVMMITAYSGLFKSALLQNMLLEACRRTGEHHLFFSLEMPATRVFERTVQIALEEYTYRVESGFHHHDGYREKAMEELRNLGADKLIVCEEAALTIERVEHYSRLARARFGSLGAIGLDYLGLMGADNAKSEYERISHVAENSKHLAKRLNVPVIILTQINRSSAASGEVEKWSAKGSGAVEASADYMLALQKNDKKELLLKVLKNRNGEENLSFLVDIDAKYLKFRSLTPYDGMAAKNAQRGKTRIRRDYMQEPWKWTRIDGGGHGDLPFDQGAQPRYRRMEADRCRGRCREESRRKCSAGLSGVT